MQLREASMAAKSREFGGVMASRKGSKTKSNPLQRELYSTYEEGYLLRTLGDLVKNPITALSELVANSWDAGATCVQIVIPEEHDGELSLEDDGCGLTPEQFKERWMTLAFNRQTHLGSEAERTPKRQGKRRAYGRNGEGRHGLLCFGSSYGVETWRDGWMNAFLVSASFGDSPFKAEPKGRSKRAGHGTKQVVLVQRNLPDPQKMREELSARFSHDPQFVVMVNGEALPFDESPGQKSERTVVIQDPQDQGKAATIQVRINRSEAGRTKHQSGVAFWVGKRLVGQPGWTFMDQTILDGRSKAGRQIAAVVESEDLYDEVNFDWTGFKPTPLMLEVARIANETIREVLREMFSGEADARAEETLEEHAPAMQGLAPLEVLEVAEVTRAITRKDPLVSQSTLDCAVQGVVQAKTQTSRSRLIARVSDLADHDIEGLHRLLDEWTVKDALTVLDEISVRLKVVEAIQKLEGHPDVDELAVLHPLVTEARWLFGPEYDSPTYTSNAGLRNAMRKVFKVDASAADFDNARRRPDLLVLDDGLVSGVATEDINPDDLVVTDRRVLLVELKKGGFTIGRKEMDQAAGYIEDLLNCGHLSGRPYVHAFVVGHRRDSKTGTVRTLGEPSSAYGRVDAVTFTQLVSTAQQRLFRIQQHVGERYPSTTAQDLLKILQGKRKEAEQLGLSFERLSKIQVRSNEVGPTDE